MSSSSSSCSAIDIAKFLIAMMSLTMSRISSRALSGIELGELRQVDRVDQRRKDLRLGVVVGLAALALRLRGLGGERRRFDRLAPRRGGWQQQRAPCAALGRACSQPYGGCRPAAARGGRNSGAVRAPSSLPLLPNMTAYQSATRRHFFFSFSLPSRLPKPAFFLALISARPVSTCAISLIVWTIGFCGIHLAKHAPVVGRHCRTAAARTG